MRSCAGFSLAAPAFYLCAVDQLGSVCCPTSGCGPRLALREQLQQSRERRRSLAAAREKRTRRKRSPGAPPPPDPDEDEELLEEEDELLLEELDDEEPLELPEELEEEPDELLIPATWTTALLLVTAETEFETTTV